MEKKITTGTELAEEKNEQMKLSKLRISSLGRRNKKNKMGWLHDSETVLKNTNM